MQYLLLAYDGTDEDALARRMRAREAHLALGAELAADGRLLFATAILDDDGTMIGSMEVLDLPSREDVDAYLAGEPYVTGDVWREITVRPCRVGPAFTDPASRR